MTDCLISRTEQKARKSHQCDQCRTQILVGTIYIRERGVWEGSPYVYKAHLECQEAVAALHQQRNLNWDEGINLSDLELEDHEWLLEEHPIVAERCGIRP
jgi:hypothetical protein